VRDALGEGTSDIMISEDYGEVRMAQLVVRNIEEEVKVRLRRRARHHGRSMEEEARDILRDAVRKDDRSAGGLGSEIAALFSVTGLDGDIAELRGHKVKPAVFD
jgi:plasmid stability protein